MESLLDEVDSLIAPGLSTDTPEWCSNCQSLRQEIKQLQEEQLQNFGKLKQKIISTDLLIKKYKSKCDDYDFQCKRTEEANKRADKFQRQCEILETQLKAALMDTEPLRKTKATLEAEIRMKNAEIQSISDRLLAAEGAQKQYEHLTKASSYDIEKLEAEKKELTTKIKMLEGGKLSKVASKEYRHEISTLKKEKAAMLKNEKRLESKLSGALAKIEHLTNVIKEKKFSPKRRRRTSSGNRLSPLKSPGRSPRSDHKASPMGRGRTRTISERNTASQNTDGIPAPNVEKLASGSESSSDDTDDTGSMCSVSWTFSPLMKCLSPLPPSPACFKERKLKKAQHTVETEEEGEAELSDIADELEQQLLQEDEHEEGSKIDRTDKDMFETMEDTSNNNTAVENIENSLGETNEHQDDEKEESKSELQNSVQEVENFGKSEDSKNELQNSVQVVEYFGNSLEKLAEASNVEICDHHPSVKEKLAHSIDIVSPTAARKRIAHQPNKPKCSIKNTDTSKNENESESANKVGRIPPIRRSARIKSFKEGEFSEPELDIGESKQTESTDTKIPVSEKSELNRNNTEEFTPAMSEHTETLSDSEMQVEVGNIQKKGMWKSYEDTSCDAVAAVDNSIANGDIPSPDNTSKCEIKVNESHKKIVSSNEIKQETILEHVEIWKEEQKVEVKQVTVPKSSLQRQELVQEEPTKLFKDIEILKGKVDQKNINKRGKSKFGPDKFINFQKSSSVTLSNEIEDFSYVDDYKVLTRDDEDSGMLSPRTDIKASVKKNLRRKIKKSCKYRDLDSESYRENKEIISGNQSGDSCAQLPNIHVSEVKDEMKESHKERKIKIDENSNVPEKKLNGTKKERTSEQVKTSEEVNLNSQSQRTGVLPEISSGAKTKRLSSEDETSVTKRVLRSQRKSDGDQPDQDSDAISKTKLTVKDETESNIDIDKSGTASITSKKKDVSLKGSEDNQTDGKDLIPENSINVPDVNLELDIDVFGSCKEKFTPARQMSTGFTVHTPTLERSSSTESAVSFRNSPSRLFHLESGHCDTIIEEEVGEEFDKDNKTEDRNKINECRNTHDTSLILNIEDLLDVCKENLPSVQVGTENAQNALNLFCDKNVNVEKTKTTILDKTKSESKSLSVTALDEEYNKPGCSYHYFEPINQSTSHEVSMITTAVKSASQDGKIQFVSDVSPEDENSLSRSSTPSIASIDRSSPVSPLSISPFNFLDPVSPLPPSPVREMERVSPLSPEHLSEEQKSKFDVDEPEVIENTQNKNAESIVKDTVSGDVSERVACVEKQESVVDRKDKASHAESKKENECKKLENGNDQTVKQLISCDKAKGTQKKKLQKAPAISKYANLNVDSLELFPLPHMISPVKTPKGQSKVKLKAEQMKALANEKQIKENKDRISDVMKSQEKKCSKAKQFLTKAPESTLAVKPRLTRSFGSLEISNTEVCVRKSTRTALKRVASTNESDATTVKKIAVDGKGAFEDCKKETGSTDSDDLKNNDMVKAFTDVESDKEHVISNEDSNELKNKDGISDNVDGKGDNKVSEEWPAGQDNLAFKRKTRVAHKPHIQPLKPHKIQIIDAPRLPPVTVGRKRKSLDKVSKDTQDKKQCKENMFQKQKSAPADTDEYKDDTKKMQAFLKSAESAESFVPRYLTEDSKDDIDLHLLNICLECLGRIRTDTLDVVYRTCESGMYLVINDQFPFLSDVEKKAVQLIQYLRTKRKIDTTVVMRKVWNRVFSRDISANLVGKMALCRVFITLCCIQGDLELARVLFYHLVTCGHMNCTLFIVSVISVWPDVLKKDPLDRPDKVVSLGMTLVFEEIITNMLLSQESDTSKKILLILRKLCNWSGTTGDAGAILKVLCTRLMTVLDEESVDKSTEVELIKALELLCTRQTWPWFKEQFIMRHGLQTAANKYMAEKIAKPVPPDYVCAILRVTSHCMNSLSTTLKSKDYQLVIRNWLLPMLSYKPGNENVRQCCLETLLELTPLYPACLDSIQKWFVEEQDSVSQELTARLEDLRLQYKQKFGLQCKPFFKV